MHKCSKLDIERLQVSGVISPESLEMRQEEGKRGRTLSLFAEGYCCV